MYWDFCLPSFWQTCHFTNRYPKQKGGHFWGVLTYCCMLRLLQMQLSQALFKGSHATMQTTQRRYQCATALRPFLEGRKSNSMKNESPYLQDGHLMSTLKNCGDIGWDLFRYLQLTCADIIYEPQSLQTYFDSCRNYLAKNPFDDQLNTFTISYFGIKS